MAVERGSGSDISYFEHCRYSVPTTSSSPHGKKKKKKKKKHLSQDKRVMNERRREERRSIAPFQSVPSVLSYVNSNPACSVR